MAGKIYYGVAASFYGNKLSVVTAQKEGKDGKAVPVAEKSFSTPQQNDEAIGRFLEIVVRVARRQAYENSKDQVQYLMPVIFGWPGIKHCPQLKGWNDELYPDLDYPKYLNPLYKDDKAIVNLQHLLIENLRVNAEESGIASSGIAPTQGYFDYPKEIVHDDKYHANYENFKAAFSKAKDGDQDAMNQLKEIVEITAKQDVDSNVEQYGFSVARNVNFTIMKDPIFKFFNLPELRSHYVDSYKKLMSLPDNFTFTLRLPDDDDNMEFFDVLRGQMHEYANGRTGDLQSYKC